MRSFWNEAYFLVGRSDKKLKRNAVYRPFTVLLLEFLFYSAHCFTQSLIRHRQRYSDKTLAILAVGRTGGDNDSGLIEQAVGEFE